MSNHVGGYDFVIDLTHDSKPFRMLTAIDEYTRWWMAIHVEGKLKSGKVLYRLTASYLSPKCLVLRSMIPLAGRTCVRGYLAIFSSQQRTLF